MFGMLASSGVPKLSVTNVCVAVAASPPARYQRRYRSLPSESSKLLPKIQRKSMLPMMCSQLPCMNVDGKAPSYHDPAALTACEPTQGPSPRHGEDPYS